MSVADSERILSVTHCAHGARVERLIVDWDGTPHRGMFCPLHDTWNCCEPVWLPLGPREMKFARAKAEAERAYEEAQAVADDDYLQTVASAVVDYHKAGGIVPPQFAYVLDDED